MSILLSHLERAEFRLWRVITTSSHFWQIEQNCGIRGNILADFGTAGAQLTFAARGKVLACHQLIDLTALHILNCSRL